MKKNHDDKNLFLNTKSIKFIILALIYLNMVFLSTSHSSQEIAQGNMTLYVGGTGENNYTSIQQAIDNASNGNIIYVYNDTYYENIILDKELVLKGKNKEDTVINAQGFGTVITVVATNCSISNFTITGSGQSDTIYTNCGIYSENYSPAIFNNNIRDNQYGIAFLQGSLTVIRNNTLSHNDKGIYLYNSSSISLINNTFFHNIEAVDLYSSFNNTIKDCTIHTNNKGIYLYSCSHNIIQDCYLSNNSQQGIYLHYSAKNTLIHNIFEYCNLDLIYATNHTIIHNTFTHGGISLFGGGLSSYIHIIDKTNMVNTYPLYYFSHEKNISLDNLSIGQLILTNCTDFFIKNVTISYTNMPIEIAYSSHIHLDHITLHHSHGGIRLYHSSNNTLTSSTIYNINGSGVIFVYSSNDNLLHNCQIRYMELYGIFLSWNSNKNVISSCNITHNHQGITIMSSSDNLMYANNFINNSQQAIDGNHNQWDNGAIGNYWSEFDNSSEGAWDNNSDGIVDSCYPIPSGDNQDCFPLMDPWAPLENQKPLVNIYSPAMNAIITNTVTIKGTAQDIDGKILYVEISIDGHTWLIATGTNSWSYKWDTTTVNNGDYIISVRSYDGISYSSVRKIHLTVKNTCILTINISPVNGGSVTINPNQDTYQIGTMVNITAHPFEGYRFSYWDGDFNGSNPTFQIFMNSDKIITVHFTKIISHYSLSVTINPHQGGVVIIQPDNETFPINTLVMITAIPNAEYIFLHWGGDYSSTNSSITITMNTDKNLIAYFEQTSPLTNPPIVYFSYSIKGKKVSFTDKSTDIDGFLVGWQWDFGDNNYSTQEHPTHTYKKNGNYTITLVATDNTGDTGNYTAVIIVKSEKNLIPGFEWIYLLFFISLLYIMRKRK